MRTLMAVVALLSPTLASAQGVLELAPGAQERGELPRPGAIWQSYRIDVPPGTSALELDIDATGDADLYVRRERPMDNNWQNTADFRSHSDSGRERVRIGAEDGLCACTYYVDVVHGDGALGRRLKYTLRARTERGAVAPTVAEAPPAALADDVEASFAGDFEIDLAFSPDGPNYKTYVVDVGRDVGSLEVALSGAGGDLDLYARYGGPMPNWSAAHHRSNGPSSNEVLTVTRDSAPRLRSGRYFIDVANPGGWVGNAKLTGHFVRGYSGPEATGSLPEPSSLPDVAGEISRDSQFAVQLDDNRFATYVIDVPPGRKSLLVRALGAEGDIDLYLRHGAPMEDYGNDPDHTANSVRSDEQLFVDEHSDPPIRAGRYFFDIARATEGDVGTIDVEVAFDGAAPAPLPATSGPLRELTLGERVSVDLYDSGSRGARFHFTVPEGARSLDVRVLGATRDVDLFLRKDAVITSLSEDDGYDVKAVTARLNERLQLDADSSPALSAGEWYLDVASLVGSDERIAFDLVVQADTEVDGDPLDFPPYFDNRSLSPLQRSLQAVAQVSCENGSGSATILSADGYLMTNHHVVEDDGVVQEDDIFISMVTDFDELPEQVFVARVVRYDEELDLALLKIDRDIYDRPLPRNLRLPFLELGDPDALHHGDMLYIAGFPSVGGFESRSSLSLTRGIVSGVLTDRDGVREWIKTDARINAGNSGGTALDGSFRYVGVPSRERVSEDDELGYSRPVTVIPPEWRALFE